MTPDYATSLLTAASQKIATLDGAISKLNRKLSAQVAATEKAERAQREAESRAAKLAAENKRLLAELRSIAGARP